ncbi:hypothetical protein [Kitasatospora sp. NPDC048538]|uniref:hypothetical protein n=1 Tax=unclassified Kitasatospora TaxID=2633591 RepID=UPI0033D53873
MSYRLKVKLSDTQAAERLKAAIEKDAGAAGDTRAPVSDNGVGLSASKIEHRGDGVQLLTIALTIPAGITVNIASEWIKRYLDRNNADRSIRSADILQTDEIIDADGHTNNVMNRHPVELDRG